MRPILLLLALLTGAVSACNKPPERVALLHPPVADLTCPAEPAIPAEDAAESAFLAWDQAVLLAGRACRDALARVRSWHVDQGMPN